MFDIKYLAKKVLKSLSPTTEKSEELVDNPFYPNDKSLVSHLNKAESGVYLFNNFILVLHHLNHIDVQGYMKTFSRELNAKTLKRFCLDNYGDLINATVFVNYNPEHEETYLKELSDLIDRPVYDLRENEAHVRKIANEFIHEETIYRRLFKNELNEATKSMLCKPIHDITNGIYKRLYGSYLHIETNLLLSYDEGNDKLVYRDSTALMLLCNEHYLNKKITTEELVRLLHIETVVVSLFNNYLQGYKVLMKCIKSKSGN